MKYILPAKEPYSTGERTLYNQNNPILQAKEPYYTGFFKRKKKGERTLLHRGFRVLGAKEPSSKGKRSLFFVQTNPILDPQKHTPDVQLFTAATAAAAAA